MPEMPEGLTKEQIALLEKAQADPWSVRYPKDYKAVNMPLEHNEGSMVPTGVWLATIAAKDAQIKELTSMVLELRNHIMVK